MMSNSNIDPKAGWDILLNTISTAQTVVEQWITRGKLSQAEGAEIVKDLQLQQEAFQQEADKGSPLPSLRGFLPPQPNETPGIRGYRAGMYVTEMLRNLRSFGRIPLAQLHALQADSTERLMSVRQLLFKEGISQQDLTAQCAGSADTSFEQPAIDSSRAMAGERFGRSPEKAKVADTPVI